MSSQFITKVIKNHWILCAGLHHQLPMARLVTFGNEHQWSFAHISEEGEFVLVNSLKHLFLLKFDFGADKFTLGQRLLLPKQVSHGYSEAGRLYLFDRTGDIYSQTFAELKASIERMEDKDVITEDLRLETSNFCSLITMTTGKLLGHEIVAFSDQYYKIRLLERADFHRMLMTTSLRTRFVEGLLCYREKRLLVYYDDSKMQLLDECEILNSLNVDTNYMTHPFVGHLNFQNLKGSPLILVHALDTHEIHLCQIVEPDLRMTSLAKKSLKCDAIAHAELVVFNDKAFIVRVPEASVDKNSLPKSQELICDDLKLDLGAKTFHS